MLFAMALNFRIFSLARLKQVCVRVEHVFLRWRFGLGRAALLSCAVYVYLVRVA